MKNMFYWLLISILLITTSVKSQNWGAEVIFAQPTTYQVYSQKILYSDSAFLITDLRVGDRYENIESFETRTVTVYRAFNGDEYPTEQPVVYFVHGGAWIDGYANWYEFVAQSFTGEMGWVTVVADYRLTSDSVFIADEYCPNREECPENENRKKAAWYPDNINDVAQGFQWVYDSISGYGGDPENIFVFGHSAGGHLASLLATHQNFGANRPKIKGLISMSGAYKLKTLNMLVLGDALNQTFHGGFLNNEAELDEASPVTYLSDEETFPRFFLLHCSLDLPSLPEQKIVFKNALIYNNIPVDDSFLMGYDHESEMLAIADIDDPVTQQIVEFIQENMTQTIQIPAGWSGISSYIVPRENNIEDVFEGHIDDIEWISSPTGYFDPANNTNTIGDWSTETGYMVKAINPFQLTLTGSVTEFTNVQFQNGWNLMPVLNKKEIAAESFFAGNSQFIIAKEVAGTKVFWPEFSVQSLSDLQPGKAYWVLISEER